MAFDTPRTSSEIDDVLNTAYEIKDTEGTRYRGMSYEDGVTATLEWIKGDQDENPFEEN